MVSLHIRSMWETICEASGWNFGSKSQFTLLWDLVQFNPAENLNLDRTWHFEFWLPQFTPPPPTPRVSGSSYVETNICINRGYHLVDTVTHLQHFGLSCFQQVQVVVTNSTNQMNIKAGHSFETGFASACAFWIVQVPFAFEFKCNQLNSNLTHLAFSSSQERRLCIANREEGRVRRLVDRLNKLTPNRICNHCVERDARFHKNRILIPPFCPLQHLCGTI